MTPAPPAAAAVRVFRAEVPRRRGPLFALSASLTDGERAWAARLSAGGPRERFVAGRAALRRVLAAEAGRRCSSVSHSGELVLVAVAPGAVGVDVEAPRALRDVSGLAARFLSPAERAFLDGAEEADRPRRFLALWTAREAVLKATGEGLPGLAEVEALQGPPGARWAARAGGAAWEIRSFAPAPGYVAAVAAAELPGEIAVAPLRLD